MSTTKTDLGEVLKKGFETSSSIFFGSLKGLKSPQSTLLLLSMASTTSREASLVAQMVKNPPAIQEIWVWSLGLGRSPGEGKGCPLQYSGLENSMNCMVHGVAKSRTQLKDFHFHFSHSWWPHSSLGFDYFGYLIWVEWVCVLSCIFLSVTVFFSLNIISPNFIQVIANNRISFSLWMNCMHCIYHIFFIHPYTFRLFPLLFLWIMLAVNIRV